jgi:hypothetical protein
VTPAARAAAWLLLVLVTATGCGGDDDARGRSARSWSSTPAPPPTGVWSSAADETPRRDARTEALQVLRDWDRRRAAAFVARDPVALSALYKAGSGLARQDLATLRGYQRRDVRVVDLGSQVASAQVLIASHDVLELRVVERLGVVRVAVDGVRRSLAPSRFERRVLRFERVGSGWRLSSARAV